MSAAWADMNKDQRIAAVRPLWDEGLSASRIAERLGVTKGSVIGVVDRAGMTPRQSPILPTADVPPDEVKAMAASGMGARHIARHFGVDDSTIYRVAQRYGIDFRRARQPVVARPRPVVVAPDVPTLSPELPARGGCCLWTQGDRQQWLHCTAPRIAKSGGGLRPFCEVHARVGIECHAPSGGGFVLQRLGAT